MQNKGAKNDLRPYVKYYFYWADFYENQNLPRNSSKNLLCRIIVKSHEKLKKNRGKRPITPSRKVQFLLRHFSQNSSLLNELFCPSPVYKCSQYGKWFRMSIDQY